MRLLSHLWLEEQLAGAGWMQVWRWRDLTVPYATGFVETGMFDNSKEKIFFRNSMITITYNTIKYYLV